MLISNDLINYLVEAGQSVHESLNKINENKMKIIFVVSSNGMLLGSFSDGDLRRLLTKGKDINLSDEISSVMNTSVKSSSINSHKSDIENLFVNGVEIVPLLDGSNRIKALAFKGEEGIQIEGHVINNTSKVFIIAEIGNNHNGSLDSAKKLIDLAKESGADCAKFQMRNIKDLYKDGSELDDSADLGAQYTMDLLKRFQLSDSDMFKAFDYCKEVGLPPLCTPWDKSSLEKLEKYGMSAYKVASADLTNHDFLEALAATKKSLICSTGMSTEDEITSSASYLESLGAQFALLHCNSTYPTPFKDINLSYLNRLKEKTGKIVGYSGHERGVSVPVAAVAMGAKIIEKHFTFDKSMEGNDHKVSLLPSEFKNMVDQIRIVEESLGNNKDRTLSQGEMMNRDTLAKSLICKEALSVGEEIKFENIDIKSPGQGLQPIYKLDLIGKIAKRDIDKGDFFYESDLLDDVIGPKNYNFNRPFGIPVRYHDYSNLSKKSNFDFVEFHLSYQDLDLEISNYIDCPQEMDFVVHSPELFKGDHILNLASPDKAYRDRSISELNRVCDTTRELNKYFPNTTDPVIVLNAGGFSSSGFVGENEKNKMYNLVSDSLKKINKENVRISIQSMPPYPWHFGGQSFHNLFLKAEEMSKFCQNNENIYLCLDISHTVMACNFYNWNLHNFIKEVGKHVTHLHISDALGSDGEGIEIGKGDVDFNELFRSLDLYIPSISFIPEIWQGHKNEGEGFWKALSFLNDIK